MTIQPRPEIERIQNVEHGGYDSARAPDLLDFSSNVNPYGPSPRIWDAIRTVPIAQHPDPHAAPLRRVLADMEELDEHNLIVGNGSMDLIYRAALAYVRAGDAALIVEPTFGEYARAASIMGAEIVRWCARSEQNFQVNIAALTRRARTTRPRIIFFCNPNNPTGTFIQRDQVVRLLRDANDSLLILDEAFVRFVDHGSDSRGLLAFDNVLIVRSLTKDYALMGLRVGYAMAKPAIIAALEKVQPPWSVNALAQAAAVAALRDQKHLHDSLVALARAKNNLVNDLAQLGFVIVPSRVHFFLMQVDSATEFTRRLLERKILVRDCTSFGLPTFVRIATRRPEENARLLAAIEEMQCAREH